MNKIIKFFNFNNYSTNYIYVPLVSSLSLIVVKYNYVYMPFLIFYANRFIPKKTTGFVIFLFILVRRDKYNSNKDLSLVTHEVTHLRQIFNTNCLHYLLYNFNSTYMYDSEIEAYAHQCVHLITNYSNTLTKEILDSLIITVVNIFICDMHLDDTEINKTKITVDFLNLLSKLLINYVIYLDND